MNKKSILKSTASIVIIITFVFCFMSCNHESSNTMCDKQTMSESGIVRLSKIEVYPQYLDEYMKYAIEVGEISLRTEPGVLTMYALQQTDAPHLVTILESYSSHEAYQKHIMSEHFIKYKQGTLHMVKSLELLDQNVLNPHNKIINYIE